MSGCISICLTCHKHKQSCPAAKWVTAFTVSVNLIIVLPKVTTFVINPDLQKKNMSAIAHDIFMTGKPLYTHAHQKMCMHTSRSVLLEYALQNSHTSSPHDNTKPDMLQIMSFE